LSPTRREARDELEAFQKGVMRGYTSQWLRELDVVSERGFGTPQLSFNLLDWIGRDRWDANGKVKVEGEKGTY